MKSLLFFAAIFVIFLSCNRSTHEHDHHHQAGKAVESNENEALYNEVMKIHDDGMEKMGEIHLSKKNLKEKLTTRTGESKAATEAAIARLDSADRGMMNWMHNFNPPEDTLDGEAYREYMELELEKVKKVREDILEALAEANEKAMQ